MEVLNLADACRNNDPLRASIGRLIEVVGTPKFESEMFDAARHTMNCEHISAIVDSDDVAPRVLMSAATSALSIPRDVVQRYASQYWGIDPARQAFAAGPKSANFALRILPEEDIKDDQHRNECYTTYRLVDRLSIYRRHGPKTYRINFYGGEPYGRFADSDVSHLINSADIVMSLLVKHDAVGTEGSEDRTAELFRSRLRLVSPKMPEREAEVCTAIMLGMTSEAIAIKLGISVNTILTYRKRAYGRLNISCQNELMRLILC